MLQAGKRASYQGIVAGSVDILLDFYSKIELGKQYVVWLKWLPDRNLFDSGTQVQDLVRPVEQGRVMITRGMCNLCPDSYSVDELLKIFEKEFR